MSQAPYSITLAERTNTAATAGMVLGITGAALALVSPLLAGLPYFLAWPLGVLAIVFGAIGLRRSRETLVGRRPSIAGLVLGILNVALIPLLVVVLLLRVATSGS